MADRFDEHAKKSARPTTSGVSRRRIVVGGSAAVAVGWTAPMLMASSAAAIGPSACPAGSTYCTNGNFNSAKCCPSGSLCSPTGGVNNDPSCQNEVGGICANNGSGRCRVNTVHCNGNANGPDQCNGCSKQPICGGEGARCGSTDDCAQATGFIQTCSNLNSSDPTYFFCRRQCTTDAGCASGQFCDSSTGFCAKHCDRDNQCQSPGTCLNPSTPNSICLYTQSTF